MILLKTHRLILKTIEEEDIPSLLNIYNKEENMRYISSGKFNWTYSELLEKYHNFNKNYKAGIGIYSVCLKNEEMIIGEAGLFNSFNDLSKLELGYIFDSVYWKKGFGKEICLALIDYAFNKLRTKSLIARMYSNNTASVMLSEHCGMIKTNEEIAANGRKVYVYIINNPIHS